MKVNVGKAEKRARKPWTTGEEDGRTNVVPEYKYGGVQKTE